MRNIYKYQLNFTSGVQTVPLPQGARVLTVAEHNGGVCFWAECDHERPLTPRRFVTYGTGHRHRDVPATYLGTAHLVEDGLVVHVYEETWPPMPATTIATD